jgi:hypothetical protein
LRASRGPNNAEASKPFTSAANFVLCVLASNDVIGAAPDFPASNALHVSFTLFPTGLTQPKPVITTLFLIKHAPRGSQKRPKYAGFAKLTRFGGIGHAKQPQASRELLKEMSSLLRFELWVINPA